MKFTLEVDMGDDGFGEDSAGELGRILRYWAGNLKHYKLVVGDREVVYDSKYAEVGSWSITD